MTDFSVVFAQVSAEVERAEGLYPVWPAIQRRGDHVWAAAILLEEAGEVLKSALNWQAHERGTLEEMRIEAIQTAAMAIRFLLNLDAVEQQRINENDSGPASLNEPANEYFFYYSDRMEKLMMANPKDNPANYTANDAGEWVVV